MVDFVTSGFEYTRENFGKKVAEEFPLLKEAMGQWEGEPLCTLQMSDFYRFSERAALDGDLSELKRCIDFVELVFTRGDPNIVDAVHVSFFEHIYQDTIMYNALSPKLRRAWNLAWGKSG